MTIKTPPQAPPTWTHTPDQITAETTAVIDAAKRLHDQVAAIENPTFESVVKVLAETDNVRYGQINQLSFYHHVSDDKQVRDSSSKAEELFRDFDIEAAMREDLFKVVNAVFNQKPDVDPESKRLLEKMNLDFTRNGLALPKEKRDELKALQKKLSNLEVAYNKNLGEETGFILFTPEELAGVPEDVLSQFDHVDGKYKMTYKYPDLFPVMKYAQDPDTRRRAFVGDQNKVMENCDLLIQAVKLRAEIADILGYKTHAAYVLEERMAKSPDIVVTFLNDLREKLAGAGKTEIAKLLKLKAKDQEALGLPADDSFNVWDYRYYDRLLLETEYEVDAQKIAEYFPMQSTVEKMLGIFEALFSLKFVEVTGDARSVWHEDCKQFAVWKDDSGEDEFVGWLYFDLHPREGKYGHAANFNLMPGYTSKDGKRVYPVTALVCNFSKPSGTKPSLLKHDEVVTFFHELGHGIHDLVSVTKYGRFHGTNVARDFVEAPSQMLEYWCWQKQELKNLSSHYLEPTKTIDDDLIEKIVKSKHVNGGLFNLRQLHFALFDMTLHTSDGVIDVTKAWNEMRQDISLMQQANETTYGYGSFGHLMGGYDSGYYGYLWSQVFAADIFYTKFLAAPMNATAGLQYRDTILRPGGAREEIDNLKELLGREPNNVAFLTELGVEN
ncbi:hypothetical protein POJ06DRAFT_39367 [Lipomyces tetrasporus]|uniref:Peptidase M3A/M3B catalytic domain-containing protein n=1 Tax=Lipomyces tetrasporus TaxID=54092 RepID=A0AAD7QKS6_9ASCO|nr:uncharacterized protein POJ06DRAFT_39367 [Lipomyces tetrasporus]KAJ8097085.1 hypothetical protein POJ06DRAFT_39367 [Lipomyces tetrasporus]